MSSVNIVPMQRNWLSKEDMIAARIPAVRNPPSTGPATLLTMNGRTPFAETVGGIGIRPVVAQARIIGEVNVCDYLDFIAEPDREEEFLVALLDHLRQLGVRRLDLRVLRPESTAARFLPGAAKQLTCEASLVLP